MAISVVQQSTLQVGSNVSSDSVNTGTNFSAGNDVFLFIDYYNAAAHTIAVTIAGVAATLIENTGALNNTEGQLWHLPGASNPGGSDAASWTRTGSGGAYARWSVMEVSGLASASALDKNPAINATTDPTPAVSNATGTLSQADEIAFSLVSNRETNASSNFGAPTGWTMTNMNVQDWNNTSSGAVAYIIVSSTSSLTAQWIGSDSWGRCGIATFKMASTGTSLTGSTETDTAGTVSAVASAGLTGSAGTDAASTLGLATSVALTGSTGADTAEVLAAFASVTLTGSAGTETAEALSTSVPTSLTDATESDTAEALSAEALASLSGTAGTDTAEALVPAASVALSGSAETGTAGALSTSSPSALTGATEADTADSLVATVATDISGSTGTDTAETLSLGIAAALASAAESGTAEALSLVLSVTLQGATETDSAGSLGQGYFADITAATETSAANDISLATYWSLGSATEIGAAAALSVTGQTTYPYPPNTATIGLLPVRQDALTMAPERQDSLTLGPVRRDSLS